MFILKLVITLGYLLFSIYLFVCLFFFNPKLAHDIYNHSRQNQQQYYQKSLFFHVTNTYNFEPHLFFPFRVFSRVIRSELFTKLQHDLWNPWEL